MPGLVTELEELRDRYTEAVNMAVAEGRDDLVDELVSAYPDDELEVLLKYTRLQAGPA